jgi:hypothetical protein
VSTYPTDSAKKTSSNNLNRQIGLYSLAAAVAGVSMLALAEPAAGEVVVTKKTIPIPTAPLGTHPVLISMANNGVDNFSFDLDSFTLSSRIGRQLEVWGFNPPDGVLAVTPFDGTALALPRGAKIGPSATVFYKYGALIERTRSYGSGRVSHGYWGGNPKDHYLGVRFAINGKTHYGWIRLTVTSNVKLNRPTLSATITGYAYETVPNKPILAGTAGIAAAAAEKPTADVQTPENYRNQSGPSLGMLAAGAEGLAVWRREEPSALQ